ncbi:hypothetical protein [Sinorhizobium arboris]|uniref:hypothetical protein n=1 Tax=Sinorhizobium arboris TaxID=76745 RepID=UPI00130DE684|nr:hypothetical protein [Sinorhizobium arboris]
MARGEEAAQYGSARHSTVQAGIPVLLTRLGHPERITDVPQTLTILEMMSSLYLARR